jgi:hypothetical protein
VLLTPGQLNHLAIPIYTARLVNVCRLTLSDPQHFDLESVPDARPAKVTFLSLDAIESTDQGQAAVVSHLHEEAVTFDRLENAVDHRTLSQINLGLGFTLARFQYHEL